MSISEGSQGKSLTGAEAEAVEDSCLLACSQWLFCFLIASRTPAQSRTSGQSVEAFSQLRSHLLKGLVDINLCSKLGFFGEGKASFLMKTITYIFSQNKGLAKMATNVSYMG